MSAVIGNDGVAEVVVNQKSDFNEGLGELTSLCNLKLAFCNLIPGFKELGNQPETLLQLEMQTKSFSCQAI